MRILSRALMLLSSAFLAACSMSGVGTTGPGQTKQVHVVLPSDASQVQAIQLELNAGKLDLKPGGDALIQGVIEYNVDKLAPMINTSGNSTQIRNGDMSPAGNAKNDWNLSVAQGIPLDLSVSASAGQTTAELGGLSLRSLRWTQGAGNQALQFSQSNVDQLRTFIVEQIAGSGTIRGLGNAQAASAMIKISAGEFTVYTDGALKSDSVVTIESVAGNITIISSGMPVRVVAKSEVGAINGGNWSQSNGGYESPAWAGVQGPKMIININTTTGNVTLK